MHKYFILSLIVSIIPNLCLAENPRITKLMREKQAKMEQLEKCMGSSKGLKIAGISTLGLTAVGVAGNIAEAKVIQDYNDRIESTDKNIEKTKIEIQEKRDALDAKEEAEAKRIAAEEQAKREGRILRKVALEDIARINSSGYNGDKAVSHGYVPEKLPENLRSQFANAMVNFIARCRSLIGQYGIEDVSLSPTEQENWRQYLGGTPLAEDAVLDDLNEHIIAECKIIKCNEKTHTLVNDGYGVRCDAKTVAGVPEADDKAQNGENGNQDDSESDDKAKNGEKGNQDNSGDENNAEDLKNGLKNKKTQATPKPAAKTPAVGKDGTDCKASIKDSNVKEAKIENGVCTVKSCSDGFKVNANKNGCESKPVSEWTDSEKKANANMYCSNMYKNDSVARACCIEIHEKKRATSWDGKNCACKTGKWTDNACVVSVEEKIFSSTKVSSIDDGKKLVAIWAKRKGKTLIFKSSEVNSTGQDYLSYATSDGGEKYKFEFDSMNESNSHTRDFAIFDIVCSLYDGSPVGSQYKSLEKNGVSGSPRSCSSSQEYTTSWCRDIGASLSSIDKRLGTTEEFNVMGNKTCYKR